MSMCNRTRFSSSSTHAIIRSRFFTRFSMSGMESDFSSGALLLNSNMLSRLSGVFFRCSDDCSTNYVMKVTNNNSLLTVRKLPPLSPSKPSLVLPPARLLPLLPSTDSIDADVADPLRENVRCSVA